MCIYIYIYVERERERERDVYTSRWSGMQSRVAPQAPQARVHVCARAVWAHAQHRGPLSTLLPASVKKHSSKVETHWECQLEKHQIRGWRAVSAAGLHGKGLRKRKMSFTDTGMLGIHPPQRQADRAAVRPCLTAAARCIGSYGQSPY